MTAITHPRLPRRRAATRVRSWWGKAWVRAVEESSYAEEDLRAGRALARGGRVGPITVEEGRFFAAVEDTESGAVSVTVPLLDRTGLDLFVELVAAESGRIATLMAGDLSHQLVEEAEEGGVELLPYGGELAASCTCPAWMDPCPHALAVGLQVSWLLEADPFVLTHLRGLPRDELLVRLHERGGPAGETADDVETGLEAMLRAERVLALLDDPAASIDHLF
ncbi:MAG: SWIM zinc finger family protein [Nocardioides sp.]|uniref:SWIM zinc finger family protein n=1 Tax=Nocardioides sp. TaxID=35761 RepID=UPI0039E301CB